MTPEPEHAFAERNGLWHLIEHDGYPEVRTLCGQRLIATAQPLRFEPVPFCCSVARSAADRRSAAGRVRTLSSVEILLAFWPVAVLIGTVWTLVVMVYDAAKTGADSLGLWFRGVIVMAAAVAGTLIAAGVLRP